MPTPDRSIYSMSESMKKILASVHKIVKAKEVAKPEVQEDPQHIKLEAAITSKRFESIGRGLYREASTMQKIGGVWAVKEFENPETHKQEKWLVSYQDSDDDIALKVANEVLVKTAFDVDPNSPEVPEFSNYINEHSKAEPKTIVRVHVDEDPNSPTITDPFDITSMLENAEADNFRVEFSDGTTDYVRDIVGQTFNVTGGGRVTVSSLGKTAAGEKIPNPKDIPIAQGIKSKNITMNETGGGGTAKVEIEFTDPSKGLDFYNNNVGGGNEKPAEAPKQEAPKEEAHSEQTGPKAQVPAPAVPQVPQPMGMGGLSPQSSIQTYTRGGKQNITITLEKVATNYNPLGDTGGLDYGIYDSKLDRKNLSNMESNPSKSKIKPRNKGFKGKNKPSGDLMPHELDMDRFKTKSWPNTKDDIFDTGENEEQLNRKKRMMLKEAPVPTLDDLNLDEAEDVFSFINEDGEKVILAWQRKLQLGDTFVRPDNGVEAKVAGYNEIKYAEVEDIISILAGEEGVTLPYHKTRTDFKGNQHFYDEEGRYHNDEGPAFIGVEGDQEYYKHGKTHNEKGPARIHPDGTVKYFIDGEALTEREFERRTKVPVEQFAHLKKANIYLRCPKCKKDSDRKDFGCSSNLNFVCPGCGFEFEYKEGDPINTDKGNVIQAFHSAIQDMPQAEPDVETPTKVDPDTETPDRVSPSKPNHNPFHPPHREPAHMPAPKAIGVN